MKLNLSSLSPRALLGVAAGAVVLWAAVLWLLYVSPHRAAAAQAKDELAAARTQLEQAQIAAHRPSAASGTTASDVLRLAKAMPASREQASLVFDLTRLARVSHVELRSISSEASSAGPGGTTVIPVTVTVEGRFRQVTRFLQRTRALVSLRGGRVRAAGRLFAIEDVELAESLTRGFPNLDATVVLDAFAYDGPITPAAPATGTTDTTTSASSSSSAGGTGS